MTKFIKFGGEPGAPQGPWEDRDRFTMCYSYNSTDSEISKKIVFTVFFKTFFEPKKLGKRVLFEYFSPLLPFLRPSILPRFFSPSSFEKWLIDLTLNFSLGRTVMSPFWNSMKSVRLCISTEGIDFAARTDFSLFLSKTPGGRFTRRIDVQYRWCRCWTPLFDTLSRAVLVGVVCDDLVFIISPRYWTFHHL